MSNISGLDGMSMDQLRADVRQGGKFVVYTYVISLLVITLRPKTGIKYVKAGESGWQNGIVPSLVSLVMGWWGFPWGLIYTPYAIFQNLSGGEDVTNEVLSQISGGVPAASQQSAGQTGYNIPTGNNTAATSQPSGGYNVPTGGQSSAPAQGGGYNIPTGGNSSQPSNGNSDGSSPYNIPR